MILPFHLPLAGKRTTEINWYDFETFLFNFCGVEFMRLARNKICPTCWWWCAGAKQSSVRVYHSMGAIIAAWRECVAHNEAVKSRDRYRCVMVAMIIISFRLRRAGAGDNYGIMELCKCAGRPGEKSESAGPIVNHCIISCFDTLEYIMLNMLKSQCALTIVSTLAERERQAERGAQVAPPLRHVKHVKCANYKQLIQFSTSINGLWLLRLSDERVKKRSPSGACMKCGEVEEESSGQHTGRQNF